MSSISVILGVYTTAGVNVAPTQADSTRRLVRLMLGPGLDYIAAQSGDTIDIVLSVNTIAGGQPWFQWIANADPTGGTTPTSGFARWATSGGALTGIVARGSGDADFVVLDADENGNTIVGSATFTTAGVRVNVGAAGTFSVWVDSASIFRVDAALMSVLTARLRVSGQQYTTPATLNVSTGHVAWDMDVNGGKASRTLAGSETIDAPSNVLDGGRYVLRITRGAGGETVTWGATFRFGLTWEAPPDAGAGLVTVYVFEGEAGGVLRCVGRS